MIASRLERMTTREIAREAIQITKKALIPGRRYRRAKDGGYVVLIHGTLISDVLDPGQADEMQRRLELLLDDVIQSRQQSRF